MGDPIELAAIRAISWHFNASSSVASAADRSREKEEAVRQAEAALASAKKQGSQIKSGGNSPSDGLEVKRAEEAVKAAQAARERAVARAKAAPHKGLSVRTIRRHHFSSALQRMSAVALAKGLRAEDGRAEDCVLCLVKGSPEAVGSLLDGSKPEWYDSTYRALAERGLRVLALAYKRCGGERPEVEAGEYASRPRDWVESNLRFAGFIGFGCPVRADSANVIRSLRQSRHHTIMLTGDAALTALHVAREVGMTGDPNEPIDTMPALILRSGGAGDGGFEWAAAVGAEGSMAPIPFSLSGVASLRANGHDLVVTGKAWEQLVAAMPSAWRLVSDICVFARMSPEGKEAVVRACRDMGMHTLMCGDGGNDVGALKVSDVGISLLSGFGNMNAELEEKPAEKGGHAETQLEAQTKANQEERAASAKLQAAEFNAKRKELMGKQKQWLEEELRARAARGTGWAFEWSGGWAVSDGGERWAKEEDREGCSARMVEGQSWGGEGRAK